MVLYFIRKVGTAKLSKISLEDMLKTYEKSTSKKTSEAEKIGLRHNASRHKVAASEGALMKAVLEHPTFIEDPFAALTTHLQQTIVNKNEG